MLSLAVDAKSLIFRNLLLLWSVLSLVGCAASGGSGGTAAGRPGAPPADPTRSFIAQGKISLRPLADSGIQGFTASYRWQQTGADFDLELWGALGQGRTRIHGGAGRVTIVDSTGRTVKSRRPQRLLRRHLGWSLPLDVLGWWLQGQPAPVPAPRRMKFQPNADLVLLEQLDWTLRFDRHADVAAQQRRPGRIRAENDSLRLTIVVREWSQ